MSFWLLFLAMHLLLFMPLYLVNFRQQPNPLAFLTEKRFRNSNKLKLLYTKHGFSDPFHFHLEFAILVCVFLSMGWTNSDAVWLMALLMTLFQAEIIYLAVFTYIFSRPPVFCGDWPLIKSGWVLWKGNRHWIVIALLLTVSLMLVINYYLTQQLFWLAPETPWFLLALTLLLLLPAVFNWRTYDYTAFHYRTVYSGILHCIRNILFGRQFNILFKQDADFFDGRNLFKQVQLENPPDVVHVCVESYGAIVFKDPEMRSRLEGLYRDFEARLSGLGFYLASNLSTAPIFTGGSWLSYSTFMYGFRFDNLQLYDGLFQYSDNFASYESIFHILNRNQYHNVLAAPLGGVDNKDVSWDTISRCFQPKTILNWDSYDYHGPKLKFFSQADTFCMPDQYALNRAWQQAKKGAKKSPVSLFYCTMNSHLPYESPVDIEPDWQTINHPQHQPQLTDSALPIKERYQQAIAYQLKFILSFIQENSTDDLVVNLFGDHQPPFVANESMGRETPVHLVCKNKEMHQYLLAQGFHNGLLIPAETSPSRHEAWQSLFIGALNKAYGGDKDLPLPVMTEGINLFPEANTT